MKQDTELLVVDLPAKKDAVIHIVGGLHYGSPQFKQKEWDAFRKSLPKEDYVILVGDILDTALKTSVSDVYTQTATPFQQKEWLFNELEPIKDQILCGVSGNHEQRMERDTSNHVLYDVFARLQIEDKYRPYTAFMVVRIGHGEYKKGTRQTYVLCVSHGSGNSCYTGASTTKAERFGMQIDGIDALITGHTHKPVHSDIGKLKVDLHNLLLEQTQFVHIQATSWLNWGGYGAAKMLGATAFAPQKMVLNARSKRIQVIQ